MRVLRLAAVRSYVVIAAATVLLPLALGLLIPQSASATSTTTTTSADLVTTITPTFEKHTEFLGSICPCHFGFRAVVTNDGPDAAQNTVVSVSGGPITSVSFSVTPQANCTTSGDTFSCSSLRAGATVTAAISVTTHWCLAHVCAGSVTATASSVTPDPNTANNTATGEWEIVCESSSGNCGL